MGVPLPTILRVIMPSYWPAMLSHSVIALISASGLLENFNVKMNMFPCYLVTVRELQMETPFLERRN